MTDHLSSKIIYKSHLSYKFLISLGRDITFVLHEYYNMTINHFILFSYPKIPNTNLLQALGFQEVRVTLLIIFS